MFGFTIEHLDVFTNSVMNKIGNVASKNDVREALLEAMSLYSNQEIVIPEKEYHIYLVDVVWEEQKDNNNIIFAKVTGQMLIDGGYYSFDDVKSFRNIILNNIEKKIGGHIITFDVWYFCDENTCKEFNREEIIL